MSYHFTYTPGSTYAAVMALVDTLPLGGGVALDLGCGYGAVAEPLAERGYEYVGIDVDPDGVADLRRRGFEAHERPLWGADPPTQPPGAPAGLLAKLLAELAGEREVSLVLLLDVIEHCPDTDAFLGDVREALVALDRPLLAVSIPNVAHVDVATRLLAGEFTYTPTGLLDHTHVQLWTERRVEDDLRRFGWMQVAANDFLLRRSDQFDADHPFQNDLTPLGAWLRHLRTRSDDAAEVNQFVRAYALAPAAATAPVPASAPVTDGAGTAAPQTVAGAGGSASEHPASTAATAVDEPTVEPAPDGPPAPPPFLSVIVRTQGERMVNLREALLCLAAQLDQDFEVDLVVHYPDAGRRVAVESLVGEFAPAFGRRVRVHHAPDGGRARPLNVGLDRARGRYVAFLDDDDLVTARWVGTFRAAAAEHPGRVVRSLAVLQDVSRAGTGVDAPYQVRSSFRSPYPPTFDFVQHLVANQSPIHTFAVPRRLLDVLRLRFDETLAVTEDWDFLLRVSQFSGVHDTGAVTAVYHWWVDHSGSTGAAPPDVWSVTRRQILDRLTAAPVLLSPAAAAHLVAWAEENVANRQAALAAQSRAASAEAGRAAFERSRVWRATKPVRAGLRLGRRMTSVARRSEPAGTSSPEDPPLSTSS